MQAVELATDLVCGMSVDPAIAFKVEIDGASYYFCWPPCADIFLHDPNRWIEKASAWEGGILASPLMTLDLAQ